MQFWPFAVSIAGAISVALIIFAFMAKVQWPKMKGRDARRANKQFDNHLAEQLDRNAASRGDSGST